MVAVAELEVDDIAERDEEALSALEAISPSMLPCILRLKDGRRIKALRRSGPVWIIDHDLGKVAIRTEVLLDTFEAVEPWDDSPLATSNQLQYGPPPAPYGPPPPPHLVPFAGENGAEEGDDDELLLEDLAPEDPPEVEEPPRKPEFEGPSTVEKVEPSRQLVRQVAASMFKHKRGRMMFQLSMAALVSNVLGFTMPLFTMAVYDRVVPHNAQATLAALTMGIVLVFFIDLVLRLVRARLQDSVGIGINLEVQAALYSRLTRAELSEAQRGSGPLTAAFQSVEGLCLTMPTLAVGIMIDLPFVILTLLYISHIGGWVVAAPICAIVLIGIIGILAHIAGRNPTRTGAMFSSQRLGMIDETAAAMEQVKTLGASPVFDRIWLRLVDGANYYGHLTRMSSAYAQQATTILAQGATVGALVLGVGLIATGDITVGAMVAVSIMIGRTIQPVTAVIAGFLRLTSITENAEAARALADSAEEKAGDDTSALPSLSGSIEFRNATFSYPNAATPAVNNMSFDIQAGERVAIIGRIGCGKSSLTRLIPRLYTPDDGAIYLDGHDIRQFEPDFLRRQVSYMSQDLDLFDDSVFENIRVGMDNVTEEQFTEAVYASGVHDFISRRPEGYSLRVGPRGRKLSGGERQAVSLARTLVRNAPIMVLDEPTASMDNQLERSLIERLRPVVEGKTLILCTHRAPLIALATRVIWLEDGQIIADGDPKEVINSVVSQSAESRE